MAVKRDLALAMRRPRSSSHHSVGQAGMTSVLSKLTVSPMRQKPAVRAERKQADRGGGSCAEAIIQVERTDVETPRGGGLKRQRGPQ